MSWVLDSSAALAWVHADEEAAGLDPVFDRIGAEGAHVPALWYLEVANALTMALRRGRITEAFRTAALEGLADLDLAIDLETATQAWAATLRLADLHRLTVYDAAYLELAQRLRLPLVTLDAALVEAARAAGVAVVPSDGTG